MRANVTALRLTLAVSVAIVAAACAPAPSRPAATSPEKLPALDAAPEAVAARYFESTQTVYVEMGNRSIAYWLVQTDTTPTASALTTVVAYMAERYANQGRTLVLRVDVPPARAVNLVWNPTETTSAPGLTPPGKMPPHSISAFVFGTGGGLYMPPLREGADTISGITTETLMADSSAHARLLARLRQKLRLP